MYECKFRCIFIKTICVTVKLNLTLDEKTARQIKSYAARKGTSVSKIAEEKFQEVLKKENPDKKFLNFVKQFSGSYQNQPLINVKKGKHAFLKEKYGI
jgi:hypothetical protein